MSVLTLALGIGATTAIFSLVYGVVIQGLPYDEAENLVFIDHKAPVVGFDSGLGSGPGLYWHYSRYAESIEQISYSELYEVTITGEGLEPALVWAAEATSELFSVFRIRPLHGRLFTADDDVPDGERVVILSHAYWRRHFGGDPTAVGRDLEVSGRRYPIVGILPPDFRYLSVVELFLSNRTDFANNFGGFNGQSIARVKAGTSLEALRMELDRHLAQIERSYPDPAITTMLREAEIGAVPIDLRAWIVGPVEQLLWILMGTVGFLLLIASANVANLFLVRAEGRHREIAVRHALGASRGQVLRGFLAESLLLSGIGCVAGVLIANVGVQFLLGRIPFVLPRAEEVGVNAVALAFAVGISIVCGLVFACLPVLREGANINDVLRDGSRTSTVGGARVRTRQTLVVAQIALSLVLLSGAGLMARSFARLAAVHPGFESGNVLTFQLSLPGSRYAGDVEAAAFHDALLDRLRVVPGVTQVGAVRDLPLTWSGGGDILIKESDPPVDGELPPIIWMNRAAPDYFNTLRIPLIAGRTITRADHDEARPVIVLNQSAVDVFFAGENPVGERVAIGMEDDPRWLEVVGIVGTTKQETLREVPTPIGFLSMVEEGSNSARQMSYVIRVDGDPLSLGEAVRAAVREADRDLPIIRMRSMAQVVTEAGAPMAFTMVLLGLAAGLAVLLGSIGVYGMISHIVGHRTGEIGIRMALGAAGTNVRRMLLREGAAVAAIGLGLGLAGTFLLVQTMESQLYDVDPFDPLTHATTSLVILGIVLLATWIPALRASRIEPVVALRAE